MKKCNACVKIAIIEKIYCKKVFFSDFYGFKMLNI